MEFKWVMRLRPVVNADDIKPSAVVSHRGTASAAEQIQ
jgi:hypothetical protein